MLLMLLMILQCIHTCGLMLMITLMMTLTMMMMMMTTMLQCSHTCGHGVQTRRVSCHRVNVFGWVDPEVSSLPSSLPSFPSNKPPYIIIIITIVIIIIIIIIIPGGIDNRVQHNREATLHARLQPPGLFSKPPLELRPVGRMRLGGVRVEKSMKIRTKMRYIKDLINIWDI